MRENIAQVLDIAERSKRWPALLEALGPDDTVIDCGANIGAIAGKFARRGCTVHCFEPDPQAFGLLSESLADYPKTHLHQAAVWKEAGQAKLFFHQRRETAAVRLTQSSSMMADKVNVDTQQAVDVKLVDLPGFLRALPAPATVLKMDIEGAEGDVLKAILEQGLEGRFELALVETHEKRVPSSVAPMADVRAMIAERGLRHIMLDWK